MTILTNFKTIFSCLFFYILTISDINCQLVAVSNFIWTHNIATEEKKTIDNSLNGYWLILNEDLALETIEYYEKDALTASFYSKQKYTEELDDKQAHLKERIHTEIKLVNQLYRKAIKHTRSKKIIADNLKLLLMDLNMDIDELQNLNGLDHTLQKIEKIHQKIILLNKIKTKSLVKKLKKSCDFEEMENLMLQ